MPLNPASPVWTSARGSNHAPPLPGKDAFHRVPNFARNQWDAVERVLTGLMAKHFGARRFVGRKGHARQFTKQTKQQKKVSNV